MRRTSLFILIVGSQIVYTVLIAIDDEIRIRSPEGRVVLDGLFIVAGDAGMRTGISATQVAAVHAGGADSSARSNFEQP